MKFIWETSDLKGGRKVAYNGKQSVIGYNPRDDDSVHQHWYLIDHETDGMICGPHVATELCRILNEQPYTPVTP